MNLRERDPEDYNPYNPDARFGTQGHLSSNGFTEIEHHLREQAHRLLQKEILERREFNMHDLWSILREGRPLTKADLAERNEVVRLTQEDFEDVLDTLEEYGIDELRLIDYKGRLIRIPYGTQFKSGTLTIAHEELGDV